jgi:hypothetical protein
MITVYYSIVVFLAPISIDFPFKFYFDGHSIGCWFMALFTTRLKREQLNLILYIIHINT